MTNLKKKTIQFIRRFRAKYLPRPILHEEEVKKVLESMANKGLLTKKLMKGIWHYEATDKAKDYAKDYFGLKRKKK